MTISKRKGTPTPWARTAASQRPSTPCASDTRANAMRHRPASATPRHQHTRSSTTRSSTFLLIIPKYFLPKLSRVDRHGHLKHSMWLQQWYPSRRQCLNPSAIEAFMKRIGLLLLLSGVLFFVARPSAMIPDQVRVDTGMLAG